MQQPAAWIKILTAGFFLLAITGFVAYRSGWLSPDKKTPLLEKTPDVPATSIQEIERVTRGESETGTPGTEKSGNGNYINRVVSDTTSSGYDSLVIIENDAMRKNTGIKSRKKQQKEEEETLLFSGSKSGQLIRPLEVKPLKIIFDSIFKPSKQMP